MIGVGSGVDDDLIETESSVCGSCDSLWFVSFICHTRKSSKEVHRAKLFGAHLSAGESKKSLRLLKK